jgi:5S rRNA maturation endonuclease (ribonuclease M5)
MAATLLGVKIMNHTLDFNDANNQPKEKERVDVELIRQALLSRVEDVLFYLLPNGHIKNNCFHIGSIKGEAGKSLIVQLQGEKQGHWFDFATNQGGDIFALWEEVRGYHKSDFNKLLIEISEWLGSPLSSEIQQKNIRRNFTDDLGKPTAKWDYFDKNNKLIACVYRYDTEDGKEFRVWDVKNRKAKSPDPRPLYNIPGITTAKKIILVEGEKSADSLIAYGLTATTAMFGANAPINKTDWSPLIGKEVIIWPDHDEAGKEYAQKVAQHLVKVASFVSIANPAKEKPEKWDAFDAVKENFNIHHFLETAKGVDSKLPSYSISDFLSDNSPMPDDLITPRLLTPSGMLLIGGAPKVGKSDFLINFLIHLAAGESFLGLKPPRPLRIFYLQAEISYHYVRERIKKLNISKDTIFRSSQNLIVTSRIQMILNDQGVDAAYRTIRHYFPDQPPDIICIDPIRNVFDGGNDNGGENDNNAMLFFLQNRVEKLRSMLNPDMGIILCHHTKKIKKKDLEDDPFQAFSGAGSLRSFYTSGLILHRPNELDSKINLYFELRNGTAIPKKIIEKFEGTWTELSPFSERIIQQNYGQKLDAERDRKADVILQLIADEALKGNVYVGNQFSEKFENEAGLGCKTTIDDRISVLATKGYIKFNRNLSEFSLQKVKSKYGVICVEGMMFKKDEQMIPVFPTHFKCPNTGAVLPVENPSIWILQNEEVSQ